MTRRAKQQVSQDFRCWSDLVGFQSVVHLVFGGCVLHGDAQDLKFSSNLPPDLTRLKVNKVAHAAHPPEL